MLKKILFGLALLFLVFLGIKARIGIEAVPYDLSDKYFSATINFLEKNNINFEYRQPYYQIFALVLILFFKDFSALIYGQLFLGLVTCLIILFFYLKAIDLIKINTFLKDIYYFSGLGLFYLMYGSGMKIYYEFVFRPESTNLLLEALLMYFLLNIFKNKNNRTNIFCFFLINIFMLFVNCKFIFVSIFNLLVFSKILIFNNKKIYLNFLLYLAIPFLTVFIFNNYATIVNGRESIEYKKYFNNSLIFWRNIDVIKNVIKDDFENINFKQFNKNKLAAILNYCDSIPQNYLNFYEGGIDCNDKILYGKDDFTNNFDLNTISYNPKTVAKFYRFYVYKSAKKYPSEFIKKYFYEIYSLYKLNFGNSYIFLARKFDYKYMASYTMNQVNEIKFNNKIIENYSNKLEFGKKNNKTTDNALNQKILNFLGGLYTPILLIFIFVLIKSKKNNYGIITCLIAIYAFLMASVSAGMFYLIYDRYIFEIMPFFLVSEFMMITYILSKIFTLSKKKC